MASKQQKFYVVWNGHKPGVYTSWTACQQQVKNYPNAIYKSFNSKAEADSAFVNGPEYKRSSPKNNRATTFDHDYIIPSISVDAACSGNPGLMEYRGVHTEDRTELFKFGPVPNGTNNIGEFLAIVHALAMLEKLKDKTTPVYSDSGTAISWVSNKKARTLLKKDKSNTQLFEMIHRAEKWLHDHNWKNPVLKWETRKWGENPADFGRK